MLQTACYRPTLKFISVALMLREKDKSHFTIAIIIILKSQVIGSVWWQRVNFGILDYPVRTTGRTIPQEGNRPITPGQ